MSYKRNHQGTFFEHYHCQYSYSYGIKVNILLSHNSYRDAKCSLYTQMQKFEAVCWSQKCSVLDWLSDEDSGADYFFFFFLKQQTMKCIMSCDSQTFVIKSMLENTNENFPQ